MATVNSLVCFGGRTGKTVTISNANPAVVTLTNHGLYDGTGIVFSTTGALPSGVTAGVTYYSHLVTASTLNLYDTKANAIAGGTTGRVATTTTGSGVHTIKSAWMLGLPDLSRWGSSGSERIYDGINSWNTARSGALSIDVEVCELGEAFTEITATDTTLNVPAAAQRIESKINGVRTGAFHAGVIGNGYVLSAPAGAYNVINITKDNTQIDGFSLKVPPSFYGNCGLYSSAFASKASNFISIGPGGFTTLGAAGAGIYLSAQANEVKQCISVGWNYGIRLNQYVSGMVVADNFVTKCANGFYPNGSTSLSGSFYGNISIGNTTNWPTSSGFTNATQNFGLTGEAWIVGAGTRGVIATTDFANYAGGDFHPANSSSPQVETGVEYFGATQLDVMDAVRPSYKGGAATYRDAGPYEFDQGYGPWPSTCTLTLTGVVVNSRVFIRDQANTTTHYDQIASASTIVIPVTLYGDSRDLWAIKVRKASAAPKYQPFETQMTATPGAASLFVSQVPDTIAS